MLLKQGHPASGLRDEPHKDPSYFLPSRQPFEPSPGSSLGPQRGLTRAGEQMAAESTAEVGTGPCSVRGCGAGERLQDDGWGC